MNWHQYNKTQLESELQTNVSAGLNKGQVEEYAAKYGLNQLPGKKPDSWAVLFFRQFKSPLIYILIVCAGIVFLLDEVTDSVIILAVLVFNAFVGALQEGRSARTLESLKKLSQAESTVVRGGREEVVPESSIVPGDILVLQEGEKVTADARVVFSSNLGVDESALTGESGAVLKRDAVIEESGVPASGQHNMLFKGTAILSGSGRAIVVGTGVNTEIGKISKALLEEATEIPLQTNIRKLSRIIIYAILFISTALFFLGLSAGREVKEMFAIVVSLAVSLIPEGLPLVMTLILVTGVWRMSKRNALVKKLQAVEALGQAKVIAVDKTGTVTKNEMALVKLFVADRVYAVTGDGYAPKGEVRWKDAARGSDPDIQLAGQVAGLISRATVVYLENEGRYKVSGDPTEAAMAVFGEKLGYFRDKLAVQYKELAEIPFDHKTKYHAIFYEHKDQVFCAAAGAPEVMLKNSTHYLDNGQHRAMTPQAVANFENAIEEFSSLGMRVVGFGFKEMAKSHSLDTVDGLVLGGLFAIEDAVRAEAALAVKQAEEAGVKVVMITGDHKTTAKSIAREAGIYREGDEVITGAELQELTEEQLADRLFKVSVFARVTPEDKMKIIKAYKHLKLVVAMTGDGVNDAPSLVAADLGVAMGKIGTEVAKEAGDIVLLDDNLGSIVAAIEEGRAMYKNIQKALLFLFSTSLGELLTIVAALMLHMPMPILAAQILWLNLVTDPMMGIALALDGKEEGLLRQKFKKLPSYFVTHTMKVQILLMGLTMSVGTLYLFNIYYPIDYTKAITISLTTLSVFQWYNGFNSRLSTKTIFSKELFTNWYLWAALAANFGLQMLAVYNPFMQKILNTTPLAWTEWFMIFGICFSVIMVEELRKVIFRFAEYAGGKFGEKKTA